MSNAATGLAPILSIKQDPEPCERFEAVVLVHGIRQLSELAPADSIERAFVGT